MTLLNIFTPIIVFSTLLTIAPNSCNNKNTNGCPEKPIEELLTGKTWKAYEIRMHLNNNISSYYKNGSVGSEYDSDSLKFDIDHTGIRYYEDQTTNIRWKFTDSEKTKMSIWLEQYPSPFTVYLENIHITETSFKYSQYYRGTDISYLASCTRVPN